MNKDRLTAREFIDRLVDEGSFVEVDRFVRRSNAVYGYTDVSAEGEGVVSGWGKVEGVPVCVFAQDEGVLGGSLGEAHAAKIVKAIELAKKSGYPIVARWSSEGARTQEGAAAVNAYVKVARALSDASGLVPTISVTAGEMFGISSAFAAMTDFTVAIDGVSACGVHAPMVVASKEGREPDAQKLMGSETMTAKNGVAQLCCENEAQAVETVKKLLCYLPSNNLDCADMEFSQDPAERQTAAGAADTRALIADFADAGTFFETGAAYAPEMITGFMRLDGISCGVVANAAGEEITVRGYRKAARFISILDAYDLPVVTLINNEGAGISLHAVQCCQVPAYAKLLSTYALSGCAKVALVTGKAVGEGWAVMGAGACHDIVYAYPEAVVGCMDAAAGSIVLYGKPGHEEEYSEKFLSAKAACSEGVIDDIIAPEDTRRALIAAVSIALNKREEKPPKKHVILPL